MGKYLDMYDLPKLNQEDVNHLTRPVTIGRLDSPDKEKQPRTRGIRCWTLQYPSNCATKDKPHPVKPVLPWFHGQIRTHTQLSYGLRSLIDTAVLKTGLAWGLCLQSQLFGGIGRRIVAQGKNARPSLKTSYSMESWRRGSSGSTCLANRNSNPVSP
jgi:hypothetical protein